MRLASSWGVFTRGIPFLPTPVPCVFFSPKFFYFRACASVLSCTYRLCPRGAQPMPTPKGVLEEKSEGRKHDPRPSPPPGLTLGPGEDHPAPLGRTLGYLAPQPSSSSSSPSSCYPCCCFRRGAVGATVSPGCCCCCCSCCSPALPGLAVQLSCAGRRERKARNMVTSGLCGMRCVSPA